MSLLRRTFKWLFTLGLVLALCGAATLAVLYWLVAPGLPSVQALRDVQYQVPLSVYSADGKLIALFGETRRTPVAIKDVPLQVRRAFIAIEDARFYEHPGVDWRGTARAVWLLATTDDRRVPGGSTITQQVARMFFLSRNTATRASFARLLLALRRSGLPPTLCPSPTPLDNAADQEWPVADLVHRGASSDRTPRTARSTHSQVRAARRSRTPQQ
ncbi:MAG: transglycosylase domain-containing protein [Microthrixaceae bacterium]